MSQIETLANHIEREMAEHLAHSHLIEEAEYEKSLLIHVTTRFNEVEVFYMDEIARQSNVSRSALVHELASTALHDLIDKLSLKKELAKKFIQFKKDQEVEKNV